MTTPINFWPDANKIKKREVALTEYTDLIKQFLDHAISADDFEIKYVKLFYADQGGRTDSTFHILDRLFAEVDAYWPETQPGDPDEEIFSSISEVTLRQCAAVALDKLKATLK